MDKKKVFLIVGFILFFLGLLWTSLLLNAIINPAEVNNVASALRNVSANDSDFVNKSKFYVFNNISIKGWVEPRNATQLCRGIYFCHRISEIQEAGYVLKSSFGHCGEHALLYNALLESGGINAMTASIYRAEKGSNHAWNHIFIDENNFTIEDASNPYAHKEIWMESYPTKRILHVVGQHPNGTRIDLTKLYTGDSVGKLIINFTNSSKDLSGSYISFHWNSTDISSKYTLPRKGIAEFNFGGNYSYTLRIRSKSYLYHIEKEFDIKSGETTQIGISELEFIYPNILRSLGISTLIILLIISYLFLERYYHNKS